MLIVKRVIGDKKNPCLLLTEDRDTFMSHKKYLYRLGLTMSGDYPKLYLLNLYTIIPTP